SRILNAVWTLVFILIVRLAIRQQEEQPVAGPLSAEGCSQVPNRRTYARIGLCVESGDALMHNGPIGLLKSFHPTHVHLACATAGKSIDRVLVPKRFEGLT